MSSKLKTHFGHENWAVWEVLRPARPFYHDTDCIHSYRFVTKPYFQIVVDTRKLPHLLAGFVFNSVGCLSSPENSRFGNRFRARWPDHAADVTGLHGFSGTLDWLVIINIIFFKFRRKLQCDKAYLFEEIRTKILNAFERDGSLRRLCQSYLFTMSVRYTHSRESPQILTCIRICLFMSRYSGGSKCMLRHIHTYRIIKND